VRKTFDTTPAQESTEKPVNGSGRETCLLNDVRDTDLVARALETIQNLKCTHENRALCTLTL
jgi:hypothetical protein